MDVLKVPRGSLAQLQSFSKSALNIVQGLPEVETETNAATTAYDVFKESMINIQTSSNKKGLTTLAINSYPAWYKLQKQN